ncbi:YidC/Oxa1 family membrane protein insertase [Halopolyspora algeriensis]|uniref:Membrane protein insertase YidC n=1 Tax=Halopolyspora algeriensis TaxID=1500506 RepID=A0A368W599_9ACTN|nr:membrane protein insertase YidC [Halopolyspora algeriensis]RCW47230.1 YidC/Oxa1 family membrane protein insertase [Halopolyspora algeriensis]TQM48315.1 YidC/Oxa1 family membrane protein insertase [Halopolyspora algeriensis]
MLDFINDPVSAILWFWHTVFGYVLDPSSGYAWTLSVVFLVFSVRALLFKPFVHQVRSMKKMQEFAPRVRELQDKYGNDRQRMAQEMQKLQAEQGFNPLGGCLPMLVQVPVFIGLFQVLNGFKPDAASNFVFDRADVVSFVEADLFGANLANTISQPSRMLADFGTDRMSMILVGVPLMIAAAVATHFTARHSIQRQAPEQGSNSQTALVNRMTLWLFPMFALIAGPFLPLAILLYWLANNVWTLAQQRIVFSRIDREEGERAATAPTGVVPAAESNDAPKGAVAHAEPVEAGASDDRPSEIPGATEDRFRDGGFSGESR